MPTISANVTLVRQVTLDVSPNSMAELPDLIQEQFFKPTDRLVTLQVTHANDFADFLPLHDNVSIRNWVSTIQRLSSPSTDQRINRMHLQFDSTNTKEDDSKHQRLPSKSKGHMKRKLARMMKSAPHCFTSSTLDSHRRPTPPFDALTIPPKFGHSSSASIKSLYGANVNKDLTNSKFGLRPRDPNGNAICAPGGGLDVHETLTQPTAVAAIRKVVSIRSTPSNGLVKSRRRKKKDKQDPLNPLKPLEDRKFKKQIATYGVSKALKLQQMRRETKRLKLRSKADQKRWAPGTEEGEKIEDIVQGLKTFASVLSVSDKDVRSQI